VTTLYAVKVAAAVLDYAITWPATLSSATWTGTGVTIDADSESGTVATARISGGSAGSQATARCHAVFVDGSEDDATITFDIVSRIVVLEYVKSPTAEALLSISWSGVIGSDTISTYAWTAASGLTIEGATNAATVKVTGGTAGADYALTCHVVTTAGQVDERTILVQVRTL
jgi:hypothetical protein